MTDAPSKYTERQRQPGQWHCACDWWNANIRVRCRNPECRAPAPPVEAPTP